MALDMIAWHDRTSADQTQYNNARAAGCSTVSLCIYGVPFIPLYAAVMVKRATQAPEQMFIGLDAAGLQSTFDSMAAQGWGPEIMTGTGPTNLPLFAAVFTQMGFIPLTRFGLTMADFIALNQTQMNTGFILRWADVYGDPGDLRYIGIWVPNSGNRAWNLDGVDDDNPTTQSRFNALVSGFARLVNLAATPDGGNLMMYDDSQMPSWQAWDGMSSADYQAKFDALYPQGLRPIRVSAKLSGNNARFSVLFAQQEDADGRTFRISGPSGLVEVIPIDGAMQAVMTANTLRGASLAIVSGTRLVYARGYTWAEPGYPDVQPTTFFRQASVSKMLTAAAIYQLIDEQAKLPGTSTELTLDTLLQDALPDVANGPAVPQWNLITIRNLLEMTSGITSSILGNDWQVSSTLPITAFQMAQWLYRQNLNNIPGSLTQANYSNANYMLLGLIVARMRGAPDFVSGLATLLRSLQITRVRSSVSVAASQPGDEARYHSRPLATAQSVMVTGQPWCALGYGDGNLENAGGGGGLSAAATDVARVLAALSAFDNQMMSSATLLNWLTNAKTATADLSGPAAHGYHGFDSVFQDASTHEFWGVKGGYLDTSQNGVTFTQNGISTVLCWNGLTPTGPAWSPVYNALVKAATEHNWGNSDLFPTYGMPSFLAPIPTPRPPRPGPPIIFHTPSHMLLQKGKPKYM
jgi:CubicO group peptidase (beta-lactamase class C family)